MLKKNIKKILAILMLLIIAINNMQGIVMAKDIGDSAKLVKIGDCNLNVQFKFDSGWSDIKGHYIGYSDGGNIYPAYCISHGLDGVDEIGSYSVDLTKILDDERVYRVIINGFPYKTPSQLGVADDFDAYLATKQAIYCVLLGRDVRAVYRGKNNSGNRVVDAIESLTHIGRYGSQRFNKPNISISRVGDLVEKENTYEQEFNVSSDIQISNYRIVATANMPEGAYIADISGNSNTNFNAGNNFKMIIPKSSMDKDLNATINITTRCKTYPVFFGKTNISGSQNYAITTDPYGDYAAKTNLNVKTNTGVIKIVKTDDETHKAIEGVTFQLSKEDGTVIANATTNKDGIATFSSLYRGKYILKEIETNEKYILNTNEFSVDVEYNKTSTLNIENEHKKGNVKVYKIDKDNNRVVLGNVEFQLYSHEFEKVIGTYYTDVDFINKKLKVQRQLGIVANSNKKDYKVNTYSKQEIPVKTLSSNRELDIPDIVFDAILEQRKIYEKNKHRRLNDKTNPFQDLGYICCSSYGRPRSKSYNFPHFKKILKENNIPNIRWHDLRATYATLLMKNKFSLKAISKRMGHAKLIITADVYGDKKEIIRDCTDNLSTFLNDVLPCNNNYNINDLTEKCININNFLNNTIDELTKKDIKIVNAINDTSNYIINEFLNELVL